MQATLDDFLAAAAVDAGDTTPHRVQVHRHVLDALRAGTLSGGDRLPSARRLAAAWNMPRSAIDEAYAQLQSEGLIERRVGNGSFVAQRVPAAVVEPPDDRSAMEPHTLQALQRLSAMAAEALRSAPPRPPAGGALRLCPGAVDTASFPLAAWRRECARVLSADDIALLSYGTPAGIPALRVATARHLSLTRQMQCRPDQVLIVASPEQALDLVVQVLLEPGEQVCIEDPGPPSLRRRLQRAQLDVVALPLDDEGLDAALARRIAPRAVAALLQPLNQWPTGARMGTLRQQEWLAWSQRSGGWLIEVDHLGEIVHDGAVPPALQCADGAGRVVFIGSYSPLLFPTLRLAYLVVPDALSDVFASVRGLMGEHSSVTTQAALAGFMEGGHLSTRLRAVRPLYRARRDALAGAVQRHLPGGARLGPMAGGTHACVHLEGSGRDVELATRLHAGGIGAMALSLLSPERAAPAACHGLLLGYGGDDADVIDAAIARIGPLLAQ